MFVWVFLLGGPGIGVKGRPGQGKWEWACCILWVQGCKEYMDQARVIDPDMMLIIKQGLML